MTRKAKGKRPIYLDNPQLDKLVAIVMALAGEVSVLRERLDTLERIAAAKGMISLEEIEAYTPDQAAAATREQWRSEYLARLLRVVEEEIDALKSNQA